MRTGIHGEIGSKYYTNHHKSSKENKMCQKMVEIQCNNRIHKTKCKCRSHGGGQYRKKLDPADAIQCQHIETVRCKNPVRIYSKQKTTLRYDYSSRLNAVGHCIKHGGYIRCLMPTCEKRMCYVGERCEDHGGNTCKNCTGPMYDRGSTCKSCKANSAV